MKWKMMGEEMRNEGMIPPPSLPPVCTYTHTHTQTNTHAQKRLRLFVYYLFFYYFFHWNSDLSDYLNATLHINQKLMIIFLKSQNLIAKFIKFGGKNFASVSEWSLPTESGNFTRNSSAYTHTYISIYLYRYIYLSIDCHKLKNSWKVLFMQLFK